MSNRARKPDAIRVGLRRQYHGSRRVFLELRIINRRWRKGTTPLYLPVELGYLVTFLRIAASRCCRNLRRMTLLGARVRRSAAALTKDCIS